MTPFSDGRGTIFVFTTPPEITCSGTVLAFEFCYQASRSEINRNNREFFRFASLTGNGLDFTVIDFDPFRINTNAEEAICSVLEEETSYICCETFPASEQVQIPSIFGVVIRRQTDTSFPLTFSDANTRFRFPHFRGRPADNDNPDRIGQTFSFTEDDRQNEGSLLLLRLIIGSHNNNACCVIICHFSITASQLYSRPLIIQTLIILHQHHFRVNVLIDYAVLFIVLDF